MRRAERENRRRAANGRATLAQYAERVGETYAAGESAETVLADLLADLMHAADADGITWDAAHDRAHAYWRDEWTPRGEVTS